MRLQDKLATVDSLDASALADIFAGRLLLVRIPNFYDPACCDSLANLLYEALEAEGGNGDIYRSDIDSYWNVRDDEARRHVYYDAALPLQHKLRRLSAPHPSPIDLLRVALDEAWTGGAGLMTMAGRKMPFGITRLWQAGSEALPHQDAFWREVGTNGSAVHFTGQLGVNLYLNTTDAGGELESWDYVLSDQDYEELRDRYEGSYGYPRTMLPDESLVVSPQVGDLILVNTMHVHAVRRVERGRRLTLSGFVGSSVPEQPLRLWA